MIRPTPRAVLLVPEGRRALAHGAAVGARPDGTVRDEMFRAAPRRLSAVVGGPDALLRMKPDGRLTILGVLHGARDRLSYALMPAGDNQDLVVYAETPLPSGHRLPASPDSPLAGGGADPRLGS